MKNKWKLAMVVIATSITVSSYITFIPTTNIYAATSDLSTDIMPMSDHIVWKYKLTSNGLYKRLYNLTKHKWVGNWIKVG